MSIDLITGKTWTPDVYFIRTMYNLGRYVDDTVGETREETTSQGEREAEFDRWLQSVINDANLQEVES